MYLNFVKILLNWYEKCKRELPWRSTSDPYHIWISEIILQQTRVAQGYNYYLNFIKRFPDIETLANAQEEEILKIWEGLGYYSRARNIHFSARLIVQERGGVFPDTYKSLLQLKGIGPYTAAAIASICFKEPVPAIDGNAYRLFARYFGIKINIALSKAASEFFELALKFISKDHPGDFNQAVMEIGALICTPKSPECYCCPLMSSCFAFIYGEVNNLPFKEKKLYKRERFFYYLHIKLPQGIWIKKREKKDIWQGLYEFPCIESDERLSDDQIRKGFLNEFGLSGIFLASVIHKLTHQHLKIEFWQATPKMSCAEKLKNRGFIQTKKIVLYPFSRPIKSFLEREDCA
ncbi:A/G-specific adenine glycosylase [Bacteroidetes bacterium endosymbiont of Geopemphigus sp.]|uniref:A/G-specific adenine glycosylase n=1 Tax=Bacteroidetes bacterium endosymbiont of Geopemphigus sp. TaxID=2047937 RepID=UPI000CD267B2|nr:A/G-specific adenine glycosylase [Bacteroidetes bacterium endosymbiont of Geopemphigus sp.]